MIKPIADWCLTYDVPYQGFIQTTNIPISQRHFRSTLFHNLPSYPENTIEPIINRRLTSNVPPQSSSNACQWSMSINYQNSISILYVAQSLLLSMEWKKSSFVYQLTLSISHQPSPSIYQWSISNVCQPPTFNVCLLGPSISPHIKIIIKPTINHPDS